MMQSNTHVKHLMLRTVIYVLLTCNLVSSCGGTLVVTDVQGTKCNPNSISNALEDIKNSLHDHVSQEQSPLLTVQSVMNEIEIIKKEQETAKRSINRLQNSLTDELNTVKNENENLKRKLNNFKKEASDLKVTIQLRDVLSKSLKQFKSNASQTIADLKTELRYLSIALFAEMDRNNELTGKIPKMLEGRLSVVNHTFQTFKSDIIQTQSNTSKMLDLQIENLQLNTSKLLSDVSLRVGFTAGVTTTEEYWYGGRFYFPRVIYAVGGGYDSKTSIFTSPVEGEYVFFLSIVAHRYSYLYLDIKLNGYVKARVFATGRDAEDWQKGEKDAAASDLVYLHLKKGDRVWVHYYYGTGYRSNKDVPLMTFSGFKI